MSSIIQQAIIQTLKYSDIFDYPLTEKEIYTYLIISHPVKIAEFKKVLTRLSHKYIEYHSPFYCLTMRSEIIALRKNRREISKRKIRSAERTIKFLTKIPTISFIGLSGSLARENADLEADIDLFIITAKGRLWITRLFALCLLQLLGRRRRRNSTQAPNSICLNFFLEETALGFKGDHQDIYTAYELMQMKPIFDRNRSYQRLLYANQWISKFVGNYNPQSIYNFEVKKSLFQNIVKAGFYILEYPSRWLQFWIINRHRTSEMVDNHVAAFHPADYRLKVMQEFYIREKNT